MNTERQLAQNITSESKAYGYTLSIWGGGSILSHVYGSPSLLQTFLYVTGALVAFALILVVVFDELLVDASLGSQIPVPSMVHLVAVLGTLGLGLLVAQWIARSGLLARTGFLLVGFQVTLTYNLLLPVETAVIKTVFGGAVE